MDKSEVKDYDGVLSINRNTFANYFRQLLKSYTPKVCIQPYAYNYEKNGRVYYGWDFRGGQSPTSVTAPFTGQTVLKYQHSSHSGADAGWGGYLGFSEPRLLL